MINNASILESSIELKKFEVTDSSVSKRNKTNYNNKYLYSALSLLHKTNDIIRLNNFNPLEMEILMINDSHLFMVHTLLSVTRNYIFKSFMFILKHSLQNEYKTLELISPRCYIRSDMFSLLKYLHSRSYPSKSHYRHYAST